jgi:3-oxoacyl-[acyl-carrier protein] reductase
MSKTILLTGASTGIGAETARLLAPGNKLFLHYNSSKEAAEQVAEDVVRLGGTAHLLRKDITSEEACVELVDMMKAKTDHLDVLINNAGGLVKRQPVDQLEWELMERIFHLNTFSLMKISSLCIPLLRASKDDPNIVNISSVVIRHGGPGATIYAAAKGAVDTFTRGLAKELAPNIRANAVSPGVIDTPFHVKNSSPEQMRNWADNNPLKKNGNPIHIALAIKLLIENNFMNGETIDVNGGLTIR